MLSRSKIFLACCLMISLGLGFGQFVPRLLLYLAAIILIVAASFWANHWRYFCVGTVLILSIWWKISHGPADLSGYFGSKHKFTIEIVKDADIKEKSIKALARVSQIDYEDVAPALVSISFARYPVYEYGDRLVVEGQLQARSEFNRGLNVSGEMVYPKVLIEKDRSGNAISKGLYRVKAFALQKTDKMLPQPQSGFLAGLLLGVRAMPEDLMDKFRTTGTTHIIAVSGFNVTIIAEALERMFKRFGRGFSFYGSLLAIAGFVVITGASASVVRAGLMGSISLLAKKSGRLYFGLNALVFAAALMMIQNPQLLLFDIGFQLSFTALAGLMFVQPKLEELWPPNEMIKNNIYPTLAAQISTTPVILYHFGNFSVIAVLTNFLILPLVAASMLMGFVSLVLYSFVPLQAIGALVWLPLTYMIKAVELTASIPFAGLNGISFSIWMLVTYYVALSAIILWKPKPNI